MDCKNEVLKNQDVYSDRTDVSFEISLFEQGMVRNPKTNDVIFCMNPMDQGDEDYIYSLTWSSIELSDVQDCLNEISDSFFDFIGSDRETELNNLSNDYLTGIVSSINSYNGHFNGHLHYYPDEYQIVKQSELS